MSIAHVRSMTSDLSDDPTLDTETHEGPELLYPGFTYVSLSGFLDQIPDSWLIWYARMSD